MTPLIDGDILLHELGYSGEFKDKDTGEDVLLPPEDVLDLLDKKIEGICRDAEGTKDPIIYLTDSEWLVNWENRRARKRGLPEREFTPNFRYAVAKTQPYKGNRQNVKPFHFYNILTYLIEKYETCISTDGLEADDMMCIEQRKQVDQTIICSRDKDLRICPGWHFSWECGKQGAIYPTHTDRLGWLEPRMRWNEKRQQEEMFDVLGYGQTFFYYQMLVGDSADHIPGLPKWGLKKAYNLLHDVKDEGVLYNTVRDLYKEVMGDKAKEFFFEQANLLWMIQEKGKGYEPYRSV